MLSGYAVRSTKYKSQVMKFQIKRELQGGESTGQSSLDGL